MQENMQGEVGSDSSGCCEELMTASGWYQSSKLLFASNCDDLPVVDMSILLESACGDVDFLVRKFELGNDDRIQKYSTHQFNNHLLSQEELMETFFSVARIKLRNMQIAFTEGKALKISTAHRKYWSQLFFFSRI